MIKERIMKVSIIIPVYNVEKYLRECVESVRKLRTQVQIILVDDGSTDSSGALCDVLAAEDARIKVVHQENGGLSAARNTGIRNSTGEYVMFLDSDDFLDADSTDEMLQNLEAQPDVLMGLYRNYYPEDRRFEKENADAFLRQEGLLAVDSFLNRLPTDGRSCYMIACRFAVRRAFLLQQELFFQTGIYHEDEEWTQRLLCSAANIFVTHHYFYQYRQARAGAITATVKPKHILDTFTIMEQTAGLLKKQETGSPKERYLQQRRAQMFLSNMISVRILTGEEKKAAYRKLEQFSPLCQDFLCGTIGTCAKVSLKLLGVPATCTLLEAARRLVK